jgi:FKBP-type peptidyl-prolyl cis-trans isomerase
MSKKMRITLTMLLGLLLLAMLACGNDSGEPESETSMEKKTEQPQSAMQAKPGSRADTLLATRIDDTDTMMTKTGLKYIDMKIGDGEAPKVGDMVEVHYTGWLEDGTKFDSSVDRGQPFNFPLGMRRVIPGWDQGVATMRVGGKRKLIIPSDLAYGPNGIPGRIPGGATLIFDVELLGIKAPPSRPGSSPGGN